MVSGVGMRLQLWAAARDSLAPLARWLQLFRQGGAAPRLALAGFHDEAAEPESNGTRRRSGHALPLSLFEFSAVVVGVGVEDGGS